MRTSWLSSTVSSSRTRSLATDDVAEFIACAIQPSTDDAMYTCGLLEPVVMPSWDVSANGPAPLLARGVVHALAVD